MPLFLPTIYGLSILFIQMYIFNGCRVKILFEYSRKDPIVSSLIFIALRRRQQGHSADTISVQGRPRLTNTVEISLTMAQFLSFCLSVCISKGHLVDADRAILHAGEVLFQPHAPALAADGVEIHVRGTRGDGPPFRSVLGIIA